MNISRDIRTLSEFKQNAAKFVKQVQETGEPVVLTVNGKPAALLQNIDSYQQMVDAEYSASKAVLKERLEYVRNGGELAPAENVFSRISDKYGVKFD